MSRARRLADIRRGILDGRRCAVMLAALLGPVVPRGAALRAASRLAPYVPQSRAYMAAFRRTVTAPFRTDA